MNKDLELFKDENGRCYIITKMISDEISVPVYNLLKAQQDTTVFVNELVDKDKNGIYISKEKATELLKDLKTIIGGIATNLSIRFEKEVENAFYNLKQVLGGK